MRNTMITAMLALMVFVSAPMTVVGKDQAVALTIELPGNVVDCIRRAQSWSECYNLLPDVKKVSEGFVGFHEGVYDYDSKRIGSIWVPTPAELITHAESGKY